MLWLGADFVSKGQIQVGTLVAYLSYLVQILMSVVMATFMISMIPRASVSADRIQEVLDTDPSVVPPVDPVRDVIEHGALEFDDVGFRYSGAEHAVLTGISFATAPGQTTAIVGSTGAGKTTLVNLILRLFDSTEGTVKVGGVDVHDLDPDVLWNTIGLVPQRPYLFSGTVASNLQFGKPDATEEEMWTALEVAQAADFVRAMPGGLQARIEQGGTNVSGGQRQRLSIARALIRRPDIYVFDDSFSALDLTTDARLRAALGSVHEGRRGRHRGAAGVDDRDRRQHPGARRRRGHRARHARRVDARLPDVRGDRAVADRREERRGMTIIDDHAEHEEQEEIDLSAPDVRAAGRWNSAGVPGERSKDFKNALRRLGRMLGPMWVVLGMVIVIAVTSATLNVFGPLVLGHATDIIVRGVRTHHMDFNALHRVLRNALLLYGSSSLLSIAAAYMLAGIIQRLMFKLRSDVEDKVNALPLSYIDKQQRGDLLSRVTNDIDNVAQSLQQTLSQMLTSVLLLIGVAIMMFTISPLLAAVALTTVPISVFGMRAIAKRSRPRFISQWK